MKKSFEMRSLICLTLCCLLVWSAIPFNVFATENGTEYDEIFKYDEENESVFLSSNDGGKIYKKLIVPAYIGDKKIKKISSMTFSNIAVEEIEFMDGIEEISAYSISNCSALKKVTIPASCKIIGGTSYMPAIEYCENLETIEIYGEYESLPLFVADCPNLKNIIFYGDVINITNEFKYNFYKCEPRVKKVNPRVFTEALNIIIQGKSGSNIEKFAKDNGFNFIAIESENSVLEDEKVNFESKYDISEFIESNIHKVYDVIDTDYGAVLYLQVVGAPHRTGPGLMLVRENGETVSLSQGVSREDPWALPEHNDIKISEDGKYVTFNVSFKERSAGNLYNGNYVVLHDAGTYYYKADLETGVCIETRFEPLDTMGEDMISAWAKPEVEKAIKLGFVSIALRENYKRNITRAEFAKMAMDFLSFSYGYSSASRLKTWSAVDYEKYGYVNSAFLNAYCHAKPDRNGNPFMSGDNEYEYNSNIQITMAEPFERTEDFLYYESVIAAYNIGIVNGISDTEFNPNGDITRQEAAAMLMRVYRNYGTVEEESNDYLFVDDNSIADWAKEDVYQINQLGVMQGVGDDMFAPLDNYTIEQAIATFLRLYENAPISRKNKNIAPLLEMEFEKEKVTEGNPAGRGWVTLEEKEFVFDDYTILQGVWNVRHYGGSDVIYIFRKSGGVSGFYTGGNLTSKLEIDEDKNIIRYSAKVSDTFRLYNQLCGSEKVYSAGEYMFECDIETGNILELERLFD